PAPPTLATASVAAPTVGVLESGVPVAPVPATLPPPAARAPFASGRPRRRAAWAGGVALGLAVLVALTILAVRSGPDRPAVAGAGTDEPDSLAVTLPVPPPDSLGGSDPPPLAVAAPEEPLPEEVPSDARA